MKINPKTSSAFSLIELMVALVLMTIIGMAAYFGFSGQTKNQMLQQDLSRLQMTLRSFNSRLTRELRQFIPLNSRSSALQLGRLFQWQRGCRMTKGTNTIDAPFTNDAAYPNDCVRLLVLDESRPTSLLAASYDTAQPDRIKVADGEVAAGKFPVGQLLVISDGKYADPLVVQGIGASSGGKTEIVFNPLLFHDSAGFGGIYTQGSQILPARLVDYGIDQTFCLEVGCAATAPTLIAGEARELLAGTVDYDRYYRPLFPYVDEFHLTFYILIDNAPTTDPSGQYQFLRGADFIIGGRTALTKGRETDASGNPQWLRDRLSGHTMFSRFRSSLQ